MNSRKSEDIMDVADVEVESMMKQHKVDKLIHGHTHRPARHERPDGERIVLGDWDDLAWALSYADGEWSLYSWPI